jgi:hypothetical protein
MALAPKRGSPLSAEAGVLLDHRSAAPVPAEPRVEVEDPRGRVPVPFPEQLHRELRHGGASRPPRRAHHRHVGTQRQPTWKRQHCAAAHGAELRARPRDRGRAPRGAGTRGRRRGGGRRGRGRVGGEDVAEEAPVGPERTRGGRVEERRRGAGSVEAGDVQPVHVARRRGQLPRRVDDEEAVGRAVEGEGGDG